MYALKITYLIWGADQFFFFSEIKSQVIQPMTGLAVARPTSNNMSLSVTVGPNGSGNPGTTHSSAPPTPLGSMLGKLVVQCIFY